MINLIMRFLSNTLGKMHWPYVDKKFNLEDYFILEELIKSFDSPFVVGLVKTDGHGSNLLLKMGMMFSKEKIKRKNEITHALIHISSKDNSHLVVESVGNGIQETSLLKAIGQRDRVILRKPNSRLLDHEVLYYALDYIKEVAKRDSIQNIEYDDTHTYDIITIEEIKDYSKNNIKLDCGEVILQALEHGFKRTGQKSLIKMVKRGSKLTWTPADILYPDLFFTFYDSKRG